MLDSLRKLLRLKGRKENKMKTLATIVTMFLFASVASAQEATMMAKSHQVKQGDTITFTVKVNPAPNVQGTVRVDARSANGNGVINATGGLAPDGTTTNSTATVAPDAPTGKWTVTEVMFIPTGGSGKTLTVRNLPSFEVTPRTLVEPDSAVVEVK